MAAYTVDKSFIGRRGLAVSPFIVRRAAAPAAVDKFGLANVCGSRRIGGMVDVVQTKQRWH